MTSPRRHEAMTGTWSSSAKPGEVVRAAGAQDAGPGEDDRPLGRGERVEHRADVVGSGPGGGRGRPARRCPRAGRSRRSSGSARRPGPGALRVPRRRPRGCPAAVGRVVELAGPFRQAADRRDQVDLLERLAAADRALDLADERRTSGSSRRWRCGCRWRGSPRRRRACRGTRPGGRSAGRTPRPRTRRRPRGGWRRRRMPGGAERVEEPEEALAGDGERERTPAARSVAAMRSADGRRGLGGARWSSGRSASVGLADAARTGRRRRRRPGASLGRRSSASGAAILGGSAVEVSGSSRARRRPSGSATSAAGSAAAAACRRRLWRWRASRRSPLPTATATGVLGAGLGLLRRGDGGPSAEAGYGVSPADPATVVAGCRPASRTSTRQ